MWFSDFGRSAAAVVALGLLSGCAMLSPSAPSAPPAVPQPKPAAETEAKTERAATPDTSTLRAAAPESKPAAPARPSVDAAVQRAFADAVSLLRAGRDAEAERAFNALAQSQPTLGGVHANLALIHRRAGRDAEAVAALEQAVKLSPEQPVFHNQLGVAYRQAGLFAKARTAYERAIELDAGYAAPQLNLAILLDLYLGDRAKAAEWYSRSAVLLPGDAPQINKWLADLKNRKPEASVAVAPTIASRKEKE